MKSRIILHDHDGSIDDFMAAIFLRAAMVLDPTIKLVAMTIPNTGEAHGLAGAMNSARLCKMLGFSALPIGYGVEKACSDNAKPFPEWLRSDMDNLFKDSKLPDATDVKFDLYAVELINKTVEEHDHVTILATGPLTNVANFIQKYPHLKNKIDIVMMGGAVDVEGNIKDIDETATNGVAEWNIYADPEAFNIILKTGVPITLVPLDATNQVPLTREFYNKLSQQPHPELKLIYQMLNSLVIKLGELIYFKKFFPKDPNIGKEYYDKLKTENSPEAKAILENIKKLIEKEGEEFFFKKFFMWDPLAAMILDKPERAVIDSLKVTFDVANANIKRAKETDTDYFEIKVATKIPEPELILKDFFHTIRAFAVNNVEKQNLSIIFTDTRSSTNPVIFTENGIKSMRYN